MLGAKIADIGEGGVKNGENLQTFIMHDNSNLEIANLKPIFSSKKGIWDFTNY